MILSSFDGVDGTSLDKCFKHSNHIYLQNVNHIDFIKVLQDLSFKLGCSSFEPNDCFINALKDLDIFRFFTFFVCELGKGIDGTFKKSILKQSKNKNKMKKLYNLKILKIFVKFYRLMIKYPMISQHLKIISLK